MDVSNLNNNEITVLKTMTLLYEISMTENEWKKVAGQIMVESLFEKHSTICTNKDFSL